MLTVINTPKAPKVIGPYSQAIRCGSFVFTSGQIPCDPESGKVCGEDIETQARRSLENVKSILEAAGTSCEKAIKTTCFLKNMDDFGAFNVVYEQYFTGKPARSCVAVAALPKGVLCEVEVMALIDETSIT